MCVSVFLQTLFLFTCIQFISVFTASANNLNQNFANPPPPSPQKNNGLSLTDVLLLDLVEVPFCVVVVVVFFFFSVFWSPIFKSNRVSGGLND